MITRQPAPNPSLCFFTRISHLGYQNIAVYLSLKMGTPSDMIFHELNLDNNGLNAYHILAYKGNYDCLASLLCFERMCLKKVMYDQL